MNGCAHLWAVGFDGTERAAQVRDEVTRLAREQQVIKLVDVAVAVRYPDGSFTLNGEPFPVLIEAQGGTIAHLLLHLALGAPPLCGHAVGTLLDSFGITPDQTGISDEFVRAVEHLIRPGTSALFVLDKEENMNAILRGIRGLGGTVLRTNVDLERANVVQSALAAKGVPTQGNDR